MLIISTYLQQGYIITDNNRRKAVGKETDCTTHPKGEVYGPFTSVATRPCPFLGHRCGTKAFTNNDVREIIKLAIQSSK